MAAKASRQKEPAAGDHVDRLRSQWARELPDIDDALAAQLVDESAHPAQDAQAHAEAHALERCLQELDAEQRQSIALAFFHGLTHSELAAHLHRPLGTVKTHVRRGLLKLRDCLMRAGQR